MAEHLPDPDSEYYWQGIAEGELRYRHCTACETAIFYPRALCPRCGASAPEWRVSAGAGTVHACTVVHRAPPGFAAATPYAVALIDLDEGFRMMAGIVDCAPAAVAVGQRVCAVYRDGPDGTPLPYFAPA